MTLRPAFALALSFACLAIPARADAPAPAETIADRPIQALPYSPSLDLTSLDRTADPCQDFYRFTCGGWQKNNPIPGDQPGWDVYSKLAEDNRRLLWGMLEQAARPGAKRDASTRRIGDYFAACMDTDAIEKAGAGPLKPALARIDALGSVRDIAGYLAPAHLASTGSAPLFNFGSDQDFANSTQIIAVAAAGGLGLPDRDYYLKDDDRSKDLRAKYVAHVETMFRLLGESEASAKADAATVMRIETDLAKASLTRVERRDPHNLDHKLSRGQLLTLAPAFDWNRYLELSGLGKIERLNVTEPNFFKALEAALHDYDLAAWKAYLRWHLAHQRAPYLSSPFVRADFEFYSQALRGVQQMPARWKKCVSWVDRDLGEALGQVYVKKAFGPEHKSRTLAMTRGIQKAMEADIRSLDWMSADTKQQALLKLQLMVNKIGYPEHWRDYSALAVRRGDFAGNVERAATFESRRQLHKIGRPLDRGEWGMTPPTVNAYYNPQMNDINFPAGVLQPPLFDFRLDDAPNYGNTGATIGHELTHGFDDEGRQFDGHGNLRDWWTPNDAEAFAKRTQCVVDQYSQYTIVDDIRINGKLTVGEDVADLGGTLLAYVAWKDATKGRKLESIDGFTPDQRFFIGMAQWACSNQRDEALRLRAVTDPHSPGRYRINGVVSNMPEFAAAFGCRAGQAMVREKPCRVW